ncbi:MAG: hypothetical protein JSS99_03490 [Actinobacteria bacterium]|nr:hypothetical protein [Actinomycetota bacterium]
MEASRVSVAAAGLPPAERPTWMRMTVLAGVAAVVGSFAIAGVRILLELTRLDRDLDLLRLPATGDDSWAWASYAAKTAFACVLFAWAGRRCVRDWTDGWDMRIYPVAVAIAFALASLDADESLTVAGFALIVVVARNVALVPRPAPRWSPNRWELAGTIVAIAVLAVVALAYRPLHPLAAAFDGRASDTSFGLGTSGDPSRTTTELGFMVGNEGPATVTVRSIHAYDAAPPDIDVMTRRTDVTSARTLAGLQRPVGVERIASGDQLHAWLRLAHSSCSGPFRVHTDKVFELVVRYETLGFHGIQRLAIDPPARLRCPGRH